MITAPTTVFEAWSQVMEEVQSISKRGLNKQQGYSFRGIDAVMNAVGPALRKFRVVIVPVDASASYRDVQTSKGNPSREVTVMVTYRVYGPAGDSFTMQAPGESMDVGDKGTPKAMSVAYRTALLQSLTIPTDEPDPDSHTFERAQPAVDPLVAARDRVMRIAEKVKPELRTQKALVDFVAAAATARDLSINVAADLIALADEWEGQK